MRKRKILRWPAVQARTGISRTTAWRLMNDEDGPKFPIPVKISKRNIGWYEDEISDFVETRDRVKGCSEE